MNPLGTVDSSLLRRVAAPKAAEEVSPVRRKRSGVARGRIVVRRSDVVALVGGDEFAILAVEASGKTLSRLVQRMRRAFAEARLKASVGHAERNPRRHLSDAQKRGDERMLLDKRSHREDGSHSDE